MLLNLIFNGQVVGKAELGGWLTLPNGDKVSPALAGWSAGGYTLVMDEDVPSYTEPPADVLRNQINEERNRRLKLPFAFNGSTFDADSESLQRISGMASLAGLSILTGAAPGDLRWHGGVTDFAWITAQNTLMQLDAFQMLALGKAAAGHVSSIIFAAKALRDMAEPPSNFTADIHWP